jgi:hypothetical protein
VFPGAAAVTVGRPCRTPGGLLVVRVDGGGRAPVAVKHPLNDRAARMLAREREVLDRLAEDDRVGAVRQLVPSDIACRLGDPLPLVVQSWLPGTDAGTVLRRSPDAALPVTAAALAAIGDLHAGSRLEPAASHLGTWVDDRVAVLAREIGWCRRDEGAACLDALRTRLVDGLGDRPVTVGWTHGDFAAGNILVAEGRVTGLIDWSTAGPDGPVGLDACTLVLTSQSELGGRSLGRVIAEVVRSGHMAPEQRRLLDDIGVDVGVGVGAEESDAALLPLLTWLWHVANNVSKSPRYGRSVRWVGGTVVPVLRAVSERPAALRRC